MATSPEPALFDDGSRGAELSPCGNYRYDLWRRWGDGPLMGLIMLNPSIADAEVDDATIRKITKFAQREGCAGIRVRNLFAYRTPKPTELRKALRAGIDIVGPDNDAWLRQLAEDRFTVRPVLAAWGAAGRPLPVGERVAVVHEMFGTRLMRFHDVRELAYTPPIAPHPLYLPDVTPIDAYPRWA